MCHLPAKLKKSESVLKDSREEKKRKVWDAVDDVTLKLKL